MKPDLFQNYKHWEERSIHRPMNKRDRYKDEKWIDSRAINGLPYESAC